MSSDQMTTHTITVPRGLKELRPVEIDLTQILRAEARIREIASVTKDKAQELMATFNVAYCECSRHVAVLSGEETLAKRHADKVRSVAVLDRVPRILAEKGLSNAKNPAGSEDLRRAVLDGDLEYCQAIARVDEISRYVEFMKGKQKGIEMAYTSVKKLFSDNSFNHLGNGTAGADSAAPVRVVSGEMVGRARY